MAADVGQLAIPPERAVLQLAHHSGEMPAEASTAEETKAMQHHSAERRFHQLFLG